MYTNVNNRHRTDNKSKEKLQNFELLTHLGEFQRFFFPFSQTPTVYTSFRSKQSRQCLESRMLYQYLPSKSTVAFSPQNKGGGRRQRCRKFLKLREIFILLHQQTENTLRIHAVFFPHMTVTQIQHLFYGKNAQFMHMGSITFDIISRLYLSDFVFKNSLDLPFFFFFCTQRATQPHTHLFKKNNSSQGPDLISILTIAT